MEENLKRNIVNKIFDMQETEICHNPYDHEQRKLFSIESGDLRQLRRCQKEKYEGRLGRVADEDLRNDKNIAIIVITLASRAAIRGGISPELALQWQTIIYVTSKDRKTRRLSQKSRRI